ncbi:MAG: bifunctional riboflavin kinase/FAD synthetase [Deltaproteobacteria bacterium]|nr:bifunctional riboflavin kinase/FAD synthetase [Deltaproteobacteria bacterium]
MRVIEHNQLTPGTVAAAVITVGNFDGVHRGHEALIGRVVRRARELRVEAVVYTFHPHPLRVLNPAYCPPLLTSFEERLARIADLGVDLIVWARFDREYAAQEPREFVTRTLVEALGVKEIWVGPDFGFGRERRGSIALLREVGKEAGFRVEVLPECRLEGEVVSSTRIRRAVAEADFETAARLLGRPFSIHGPVIHGAARGRRLGFPTANVLPREECLPPSGVYAAWAQTPEGEFPAAVNIGPNPTFGASSTGVEAHLLDFTGDLYGQELRLRPVARIRGEIAFRSVDDLVNHIRSDVREVRRVLGLAPEAAHAAP